MSIKTKVVLVSFANGAFYEGQRKLQTFSARYIAKFDEVYEYGIDDIDKAFYEKNRAILEQPKGVGLWLWKPYFLNQVFEKLLDGDYLFHCDSASIFLKKIEVLIKTMDTSNADIMLFNVPLIEKTWTTPYVLDSLNVSELDRNSNQFSASFFVLKKTKKSEKFLKDWLAMCQVREFIEGGDVVNQNSNSYFKQHRYDQSLLSILAKKEAIVPFRDPSQYGEFPERYRFHSELKVEEYPNSNYPTIILLLRINSWYEEYFKYRFKKALKKYFPAFYKKITS